MSYDKKSEFSNSTTNNFNHRAKSTHKKVENGVKEVKWLEKNRFWTIKTVQIYCYPTVSYLKNINGQIKLLLETKSKFSLTVFLSAKTMSNFFLENALKIY